MSKKALEIDMIAGSQLRDTQGEMLDIAGADISELESGRGRLNDNHGKGFFNSVGYITGAKKIFKEEDCEDERHRHYWNKIKVPFIYAKGVLYDDSDHPNAKAAAAVLRHIHKNDVPLKLKASVEGGTIARGKKDESILAQTKIHSVALTFTPANKNTSVEPISLQKSATNIETDYNLIKSVSHLMSDAPSFIDISRKLSIEKIKSGINKIKELSKALSAGYGGDIPTNGTGGQVLQSESLDKNIECPNCGKKQTYFKNQVKCIGCNKTFPLETLYRAML